MSPLAGGSFPDDSPEPEAFDVVAYVLPDGIIRYEAPLERLHEPDPGAVAP